MAVMEVAATEAAAEAVRARRRAVVAAAERAARAEAEVSAAELGVERLRWEHMALEEKVARLRANPGRDAASRVVAATTTRVALGGGAPALLKDLSWKVARKEKRL
ncbi:hypothetical protein I4F81_008827 [Pyropia yezoensis]|uniref:Uncharacterized protein n=1 Tax=Pyropia yezoensis TaxID=2788 RepID=A0ACC3C930_PYRYE|nr:hypothetical protein I4F81_008827 [Neopyropia yezoensis]